jgi:serine/threonine-protein kinase
MPLTPGQRLGSYEIIAKLGEGGMGEVYRATDPSLKRDVAIKVLPPAFAGDAERIARFEREAQVLAQLHHPHIASIFGFHEAEGIRFIALELVPGETLEERIARGPIPHDEVVAIAAKIADGLEYAHERGIVHRDLKPANVKLTADGDVKILDFGLAKAVTGEITGGGPTSTPTIVPTMTSAGTAIGMILGTAAYMSPEQARGRPVDKRADIWAFGALVHEMLTGQRLFDGETVSDTIAAVLTRPVDVSVIQDPGLRRLIARCLERDPKVRLRDIGEARIALGATSEPEPPAVRPESATRRTGRLVGLLSLIAVAGLAAGWAMHRPPRAATGGARWSLAVPDGLSISTAEQVQIAVSRDGKHQAVIAVDANAMPHILLRSEDELEPRLLPDTERATSPFFSPDGNWLAFFRDAKLFKIPVAGGPPVHLADTTGQPRGATWSRDGFIYLTVDAASSIVRVSQDGGAISQVTKLDDARGERTHRWPEALPDGTAVLFTCDDQSSTEYYDDARIEAVRPASGERKVVLEGASMARYAPSGHLVFARGGTLYAVRFDPKSLTTSGSPFPVVQGVATDISTGAVAFAVSNDGRAVWVPGDLGVSWRQLWVDRQGTESSVAIPPAPYNELSLSPDGKRVALTGGQGGISDLWVFDIERESMTRLTLGQFVSRPTWTPDGKRIAFGTRLQGPKSQRNIWQIAWKPADGSSEQEPLLEKERALLPSGFTPDGKTLLYDAFDSTGTQRDIWCLPLEGAREPRTLVGGPGNKTMAVVSPDGHFVAYSSTESGLPSVFVRPYPSGEARWQISAPQGTEPRWSADGHELFYRWGGAASVVHIDSTGGFKAGRPERLFDRVAMANVVATFGVAPDGKRLFTFRSPTGVTLQRTVDVDLGFASKLAATRAKG